MIFTFISTWTFQFNPKSICSATSIPTFPFFPVPSLPQNRKIAKKLHNLEEVVPPEANFWEPREPSWRYKRNSWCIYFCDVGDDVCLVCATRCLPCCVIKDYFTFLSGGNVLIGCEYSLPKSRLQGVSYPENAPPDGDKWVGEWPNEWVIDYISYSMREWQHNWPNGWPYAWPSEWPYKWVTEWENHLMVDRVSEWVSDDISNRMSQWHHNWPNEWLCISDRVGKWPHGWPNE